MLDINKIKECWLDTKETLKTIIPKEDYELHIEPLQFEIKDSNVLITAQNDLSKEIIKSAYIKKITEIFIKKLGFSINIFLTSELSATVSAENKIQEMPKRKISFIDDFSMSLKEENTFENFIIGKNSQFAHACCFSVANNSKMLYNPLFIYGESGLGKTHLMQAIGNYIKNKNEYAKIFYTTAEYFSSLYVEAVRDNKLQNFRKKIRNYDIFLLDDIQFLMNKEGSITEFFHTFNALENTKKQIVLTSDRAPKDLQMDDRIISRFEQGIITDITKPDLETRIAILKGKCQRENVDFSADILEYIAKRITDNVRILQGALFRLIVQSSILNEAMTLDKAAEILNRYYEDKTKTVDIKIIIEAAAKFFNVTIEDLTGSSRVKDIVNARQAAMYLARELTEMSLPAIGKSFGNRDHTTVMHSCRKVEDKFQNEPGFREQINTLTGKIIN